MKRSGLVDARVERYFTPASHLDVVAVKFDLDVMAGQVAIATQEVLEDIDNIKESDLLEMMKLDMEIIDKKEIALIKTLLDKNGSHNSSQFKRAFKVKNLTTEDRYKKWLKDAKNQNKDLLWHGSRNENWWSIYQQGLKIRPSNAVHTGSMFGDGKYFASKAQKSIGYTSLENSYWAKGNSRSGID